jgi:hypothetical protein
MLLATMTVKATVHTVSNDVNNPAQYTSAQTAHDAASIGDTLLVYGSTTNYGSLTIKKRIVLIGAGYYPNNQFGNATSFSSISLDSLTGVSGASNSEISGIYCESITSNIICNHVNIHRNKMNHWISLNNHACKNWKIFNNIFVQYSTNSYYHNAINGIGNSINTLISNNIFIENKYISNANSSTLITNNLFITGNNSYGSGSYSFKSCSNSTITNNIFYQRKTTEDASCSQNTLSNNIGYGTAAIVTGTNMGGNNSIADPKFILVGTNQGFDYSDNYALQASSPALNAGSDGTDIGIYGGSFPFPHGYGNTYRYAPMPNVPIIMNLNLNTTNIPQNTNLNFTIKARKGDE